jgi:hypothetical protein
VYLTNIRKKSPDLGNRNLLVKFLLRDHERIMAIRLDRWIKSHGEALAPEALQEIRGICADQIAEVLR